VVRPGEEAHWQEYAGSRRIAWKTGTSFGLRDAWAIGVTPKWTVAVWIGNATGEGRAELRSAITSAPVLFELFSALDSVNSAGGIAGGGPALWFPLPAADLKTQEVCAWSGYPAGPDCGAVKRVSLPRGAPPHAACQYCQTITLNEAGDRRVILTGDSGQPVQRQKWFVLPPAEEWYFRRWKVDYKPLPSFQDDSAGHGGEAAHLPLALFNPEPGARIFVPHELDGREGRIVFSAAHREQNSRIHWHLDSVYLGYTMGFHEMEGRPEAGRHTLTLVDEAGNTLIRRFEVL
jgi:penicillin-binding protein 1C